MDNLTNALFKKIYKIFILIAIFKKKDDATLFMIVFDVNKH